MGFRELEMDLKKGNEWVLKCPTCQSNKIEISEFPEFEKLLCSCENCKVNFIVYAKNYKGVE